MNRKIKEVVMGLGVLMSSTGPVMASRSGAQREGDRRMPKELKRCGFRTFVFEGENYWRISYGKKA